MFGRSTWQNGGMTDTSANMDYKAYLNAYFVDPTPVTRFPIAGLNGVSLYIQDYDRAVTFYREVLGPPAYVEGQWTHGWSIGKDWLTLFPSKHGGPINMDMTIEMATAEAVAELYQALIDAGAQPEHAPSDQLMYRPVRYASVTDPFGTVIVIVSRLADEAE
jgi:hypothetical protein